MAALALVGVVVLSLGPDVNPGSELMDNLGHTAASISATTGS